MIRPAPFGTDLLALALLGALAACGSGAPVASAPPSAPPPQAMPAPDTLATVDARLDALLGATAACSADSECRTVAVGAKACGGPSGYRAYSIRVADPAQVEALAAREHALAAQALRDSHRVSDCMMVTDPGARCEQQRCVTGAGTVPAPRGPATR